MSVERTRGIILRVRALTETSLIVHWLTPDQGRMSTVAKGAKRPKSPFRGKLDLFYSCDLSYQRSRRSDLHTLREVALREANSALRIDINRLRQAAYAAMLIEALSEVGTPLPGFYELMTEYLQHLHSGSARPLVVLGFEVRLLDALGLSPSPETGSTSAGAGQIISFLQRAPFQVAGRLEASASQRKEIQFLLGSVLLQHLGRPPRGRELALDAGAGEVAGG